jgi:hypothetical protein
MQALAHIAHRLRSLITLPAQPQAEKPTEPSTSPVVLSQELDTDNQGLALQRSTDTIRETTKWLTGAFAAVGAALIAGLQLAKLGQLQGGGRIAIAIIGLAIALTGVGRVILKASDVLTVRYVSSEEISREQIRDELKDLGIGTEGPTLLPSLLLKRVEAAIKRTLPFLAQGTADDLDELSSKQKQTYDELLALEEALRSKPSKAAGSDGALGAGPETGADKALEFQLLKERERRLDRGADRVIAFANDFIARQQFVAFRTTCVQAGAAVALGAVLLAWGLNPPTENAAIAQGPRVVDVYLWKPVSSELKASLGANCVARPSLRAVTIGGSLEEPLVVLDPANGCTARRLTITHDRGVALPSVSSSTTTTTLSKP